MLGKCAHTASLASKRFECEVKRESYPSPCRSFRRVVRFFLPLPRLQSSASFFAFSTPLALLIYLLSPLHQFHPSTFSRFASAAKPIRNRSPSVDLEPNAASFPIPCVPLSREGRKKILQDPRRSRPNRRPSITLTRTLSRGVGRVEEFGPIERVSKSSSVTDQIDARIPVVLPLTERQRGNVPRAL